MESAQQTVLQGDICVKILRFCDWLSRAHVAALNRQVRSTFAQDAHWQWMCRRLVDESLLFCPETLCAPTWRHLFLELFPLRTLFEREPARACEDGQLSPIASAPRPLSPHSHPIHQRSTPLGRATDETKQARLHGTKDEMRTGNPA